MAPTRDTIVQDLDTVLGEKDARIASLDGQLKGATQALTSLQSSFDAYRREYPATRTLMKVTFDSLPLGPLKRAGLASLFPPDPNNYYPTDEYLAPRASIVAGVNGRKALRVTLPENSLQTFVFQPRYNDWNTRHIRFTQELMLATGFESRAGGKLNGFGFGAPGRGVPAGGADPGAYCSCRVMWGSGLTCEAYTYHHAATTTTYGEHERMNKTLLPGRLQETWVEARFNDRGQKNGMLHAGLDSIRNLLTAPKYNAYEWVSGEVAPSWNTFLISAFRGGQGDAYISTKRTHVDFYSFECTADAL